MSHPRPVTKRAGFTLIELLVVISIIAMLISLVAPAIQSSRRAARRIQCLSNMRNVGVAVQSFATQNSGRIPLLHGEDGEPDGVNPVQDGPDTWHDRYQSWPRQLLPYLDQPAMDREIRAIEDIFREHEREVARAEAEDASPPPLPALSYAAGQLDVFTCPDDPANFGRPGGLSFVVNAGYVIPCVWGSSDPQFHAFTLTGNMHGAFPPCECCNDWEGPPAPQFDGPDVPFHLDLLVFHRRQTYCWAPDCNPDDNRSTSPRRATLDRLAMADGLGTTLMLSENLDGGLAVAPEGWLADIDHALAFAVEYDNERFKDGDNVWKYDSHTSADCRINARPMRNGDNSGENNDHAPRPSSNHPGVVNVMWCDGHGGTLSDAIDVGVYCRVVTGGGSLREQAAVDELELGN